MSILHIRQVKKFLETNFKDIIDIEDVKDRVDKENFFLSRSLSAFAILKLSETDERTAAQSVTDGSGDNGIDAIHYSKNNKLMYFVQSKWKHDGKGSIERGDIQKFLKGINDIIAGRFDRFNRKIQDRQDEIESALTDARVKFVLVICYSGKDPISQEVSSDINDFLEEINDISQIMTPNILRLGNIYSFVLQGIEAAPIDVDVVIHNWGVSKEPYEAFYGQVAASDIVDWWFDHYQNLFSPNIRHFLGETDVNESLLSTLTTAPQNFWYFNNGITALCSSIKRKPIGGSSRESGTFEIKNLRVVNGAQTVGSIANASALNELAIKNAKVQIRFIDLGNAPEGFDKEVTRANNTQNRIDRRDFVALDQEQERIKSELQLEGVQYAYKSGELIENIENSFSIDEATIARACGQDDVSLTVQAKREIGKLWDDIEKPPYKILFNKSVNGPDLWRTVQIVRKIEEQILLYRKNFIKKEESRNRLYTVHGNRMLEHLVLNDIDKEVFDTNILLDDHHIDEIKRKCNYYFARIIEATDDLYPDDVFYKLRYQFFCFLIFGFLTHLYMPLCYKIKAQNLIF